MTGPIVGHPDFQTPVLWSGEPIADLVVNIPANGLQNLANGAGLNFAGLIISVLNANFFGTIIVQGTVNSSIAGVVTRNVINFPPGTFTVRVPVTGDFYGVKLQNNTGIAGTIQELTIVATNNVAQKVEYHSDNNYITQFNQSVGAGANVKTQLPAVQPGPAQVTANTGAAGGVFALAVGVYAPDGSFNGQLAEFDPFTFNFSQVVYLPDQPCFLQMFNTSGAAAFASWSMWPTGQLF